MLALPAVSPLTVPAASTDATVGVPVLHEPPGVALVSPVVSPSHTCVEPVMSAGKAFTTMPAVFRQPVGKVYIIVAPPALTPLTTPAVFTVATDAAVVLQVP